MYTNSGLAGVADASQIIASIANAASGIVSAVRQPAYFPPPVIYGASAPPYADGGNYSTAPMVYQAGAGSSFLNNPLALLGIGAGLLLLLGSRRRKR